MKQLVAALIVLLSAASAFAQFDFPNTPTANQIVIGPAGQGMKWDGTKWVAQFGSVGGPFLPLAGGTMTGPLVLSGNATAPLNPVTLQQLTAITGGGTGPWLPVNNPTYTGTLTGPIQVNTGDLNSLIWNDGTTGLAASFGDGYGNTSESSFLIGQSMSYNASVPNSWTLGGTAADGPTSASSIQMFGAATVFTGDTGLTTGQAFTPTMLFSISPVEYDGAINIMGNHIVPAAATFYMPLLLPNTATTSLFFGTNTTPVGSLMGYGAGPTFEVTSGGYYDGTNWRASGANFENIAMGAGNFYFYANGGLTAGQAVTTPIQILDVNSTGMSIPTGAHYQINGQPLTTDIVAFSATAGGQTGGSCTATTNNGYASRVGNHVLLQLNYVATCTAMTGWFQISGFPWHNTSNTNGYSYCVFESGGLPYDTNYWPADCRMLPTWNACIPVEIASGAPATYYNAALIPANQQIAVNMTCNYLVDSMSP